LPRSACSDRARIGGSALLDGTELVGAPVRVLEGVRGKRIAMIFQDPSSSLNPVHRIGRQIGEALALHRGLGGNAARAEAVRLLDRVGIPARKRPGASGCTTPRSMRNLDTPICVRTVQPRERSCSATANSRSLS
jgi:ABC-type microcin C transport system duplicated ATPase subunit YejF